MLSVIKTIVLQGLDGVLVNVEVDISQGMPSWEIIGLPDTSVKESKERVRTAIKNCGINLPSRKYVINLSPANIKKEGSLFDISIAVGVLESVGKITKNKNLDDVIFIGELSLDGRINPVNGVLPICIEALKFGVKTVIVPKENAEEASVVKDIEVVGVSSLQELIAYLNCNINIQNEDVSIKNNFQNNIKFKVDFNEVKGQESVKRALEIAVAGRS